MTVFNGFTIIPAMGRTRRGPTSRFKGSWQRLDVPPSSNEIHGPSEMGCFECHMVLSYYCLKHCKEWALPKNTVILPRCPINRKFAQKLDWNVARIKGSGFLARMKTRPLDALLVHLAETEVCRQFPRGSSTAMQT